MGRYGFERRLELLFKAPFIYEQFRITERTDVFLPAIPNRGKAWFDFSASCRVAIHGCTIAPGGCKIPLLVRVGHRNGLPNAHNPFPCGNCADKIVSWKSGLRRT